MLIPMILVVAEFILNQKNTICLATVIIIVESYDSKPTGRGRLKHQLDTHKYGV